MYKTVILLSLLFCSRCCAAQTIENVFGEPEDSLYAQDVLEPVIMQPDTTLIKNATFISPDSIEALKRKKEFAYVPTLDSLLQNHSEQSDKRVSTSLSLAERFLNSSFFRFFVWLIPITLLLIVLYNFATSRGLFNQKKRSNVIANNEDDVENTTQDYLALSREAAAAGQFRPAVKYLFLRTLQQLASSGMINYASDKTNYTYVQEIASDKRKEFAKLVLSYEYIWYGNAIPEKTMYTQIENDFTAFLRKHNLN